MELKKNRMILNKKILLMEILDKKLSIVVDQKNILERES